MRWLKLGAVVLMILVGINLRPMSLGAQTGSGRLVEDELESQALAGNLLGDSARRAVTVYLPPGYDQEPGRRYPVVYWLHGFKAKNRLSTEQAQPGRGWQLQDLADDLINRGTIQPLIIVMPDAANAYGGSFYLNSEVTGNWEDFICRDLVGHIDRTYRTIPEAGARGIAGHSMGGYGALMLGLRHPEIFRAVYALSPACLVFAEHFLKLQRDNLLAVARVKDRDQFADLGWRDQVVIAAGAAVAPNPGKPPWLVDLPLEEADGRVVLQEAVWQRWLKNDPYTLLEPLKANLARIKLGFEMGLADRMLPQCRMVHEALDRLGVAHSYAEYQGDHVSQLRERWHDRGLPFLAEALQDDREEGRGKRE
jgi:S-formylglutathione hydrolase